MDPVVADEVNRSFKQEEFRHALNMLRECARMPQVDMMFGLPAQTAESFQRDLIELQLEGLENVLFSPLMVFPGTKMDAANGEMRLSIMDTPQRYGHSKALNQDDYASLIMLGLSYQVLSRFRRANHYIRSIMNNRRHYEQSIERWFSASLGPNRDAVLALHDELSLSSGYIRSNASQIAASAAGLLIAAIKQKLLEPELLTELARMDILEAAMRMRKLELSRDILPQPSLTRMITPDEFVKLRWCLNREAWLEIHNVPSEIAVKGEDHLSGESSNQVFCVYFCPAGKIFYADEREFSFLGRFAQPAALFDAENPFSSEIMELAGKWSSLGILQDIKGDTVKG
jgi:hypothetical protein